MRQLFVARDGKLRGRWEKAFPGALAVRQVGDLAPLVVAEAQIVWMDNTGRDSADFLAGVREAVGCGYRVVVMTPTPSEADAFRALSTGAVGYCHLESAPEQLREIALVVEHGGLWMLPELVQRLMALSLRAVPTPAAGPPQLNDLTPRELMVAERVAHGASNREIAEDLDITERTVKAHMSIIFEKLGVRDRVQLALAMNNIPTYATVN